MTKKRKMLLHVVAVIVSIVPHYLFQRILADLIARLVLGDEIPTYYIVVMILFVISCAYWTFLIGNLILRAWRRKHIT